VTSFLVRFPFVNMHCNFVSFGDLAFLTASVVVKKGCSLTGIRCFSLRAMHVIRQCTDAYWPPLVCYNTHCMHERKNAQGDLVNSLRSHCLWVAKQGLAWYAAFCCLKSFSVCVNAFPLMLHCFHGHWSLSTHGQHLHACYGYGSFPLPWISCWKLLP
jgi:hypothetical protein